VRKRLLTVAALVTNGVTDACLWNAIRGRANLVTCGRIHELLALLATEHVDLMVVSPWDAAGDRVAPVLRQVRDRLPSVPIAIYCELTADAVREVVPLTKAGADEVIFHAADDHAAALWSRLLVSVSRHAADEALAALHSQLSPAAEPVISYCLTRAEAGISVAEVAEALQVHRKTLVNRMAAAGLPAPACLISWCRLLLAARLLEEPGRAVEQVALKLGFGSGAALRNMLRRYTGLRPSELREHGGMRCLLERFRQSALRPKPDAPSGVDVQPPCPPGNGAASIRP
jgi:AraC-like DNA-binding protein